MEIPNPERYDRPLSKGEQDQIDGDITLMGLALLGWTLTENEKLALKVLVGAVRREGPKTERSKLVKLIRLIIKALT